MTRRASSLCRPRPPLRRRAATSRPAPCHRAARARTLIHLPPLPALVLQPCPCAARPRIAAPPAPAAPRRGYGARRRAGAPALAHPFPPPRPMIAPFLGRACTRAMARPAGRPIGSSCCDSGGGAGGQDGGHARGPPAARARPAAAETAGRLPDEGHAPAPHFHPPAARARPAAPGPRPHVTTGPAIRPPPADRKHSGSGRPNARKHRAILRPGAVAALARRIGDAPLITLVGMLAIINGPLSHLLVTSGSSGLVVGVTSVAVTAIIVFSYSVVTDRYLRLHLRDHRLVRGGVEGWRQARKVRAIGALHASACSLERDCTLLARMGARSGGVREAEWLQYRADLLALHAAAARSAYLSALALRDADHLVGGGACDDILAAIGLLEDAAPIDDAKGTVDTARHKMASDMLRPVLVRLERRLCLAKSRPPLSPTAEAPGRLILRLDRDTYPPGAAVRATVEARGQLRRRKVTITVHGKSLSIRPKKTGMLPEPEPGHPAAIALSVDVARRRLDAGQEYTARARCGGLSDEAVFVIDRVAPTVHADKSVCAPGDYLNITVDDPAAGVDSAGYGPAGAAGERRLTIESPCDRNEYICLEEAGQSPGRFRARVRCAAAVGSGSGGSGYAKGDTIACGPNQLVRIKYERGGEGARTAVLVEEPGSAAAAEEIGPAPACSEGGGSRGGSKGGGGGRHGAAPEPHGREGGRAGCMQGGPNAGREEEGAEDAMAGAFAAAAARTARTAICAGRKKGGAAAPGPVRDAAGAAKAALYAAGPADLAGGAGGAVAPPRPAAAPKNAYHANSPPGPPAPRIPAGSAARNVYPAAPPCRQSAMPPFPPLPRALPLPAPLPRPQRRPVHSPAASPGRPAAGGSPG